MNRGGSDTEQRGWLEGGVISIKKIKRERERKKGGREKKKRTEKRKKGTKGTETKIYIPTG